MPPRTRDLRTGAGWEIIRNEPAGAFTKYILGWAGNEKPVFPAGITNPWTEWTKLVDAEIAKEQKRLDDLKK
jgi:hypothetical protein